MTFGGDDRYALSARPSRGARVVTPAPPGVLRGDWHQQFLAAAARGTGAQSAGALWLQDVGHRRAGGLVPRRVRRRPPRAATTAAAYDARAQVLARGSYLASVVLNGDLALLIAFFERVIDGYLSFCVDVVVVFDVATAPAKRLESERRRRGRARRARRRSRRARRR